jgi:hypothetical protein
MSYKTLHDIGEPIPVPGKENSFVKVQVMEAKNDSSGDVSAVLDIRVFAGGKPQMGQGIVLRHPDMLDKVAKAIGIAKSKLQAEQDRLAKNGAANGQLSKLSKDKKLELFKLLAADLGVSLDDDEEVDDDEIEDEEDVLEVEDNDEDDDAEEDEDDDEEVAPEPAPKAKARTKAKVKHIADVYEADDTDENGNVLYQGLCECGWESSVFKTIKTADLKVQAHLADSK